jgi:hypothetical protein
MLAPSAADMLMVWWPRVLESWAANKVTQVRSLFLLVLRSIWLERNCRAFWTKARTEALLLDAIVKEADRWKLAGLL